jgi:ubiquinone/menaquinone biosynthesis C-methylase UbiE
MAVRGETMNAGILLIILTFAASVALYGLRRINIPRKPGFEGIEAPETADAYNRISRWPQFRLLRLMFVRKLADYAPSGILADIGCGPGYLATLIAQRHPQLHVLGLDAADEMVKAAESSASNLGLSDRVKFRRGDAADLPLRDGTLDFAVSTLSLHHWSDPTRGLAEAHRVLKPGGQLLLFDLRRDSRRLFLWLVHFAQGVVVPAALRRANEPLGSLQSSYSLAEVEAMLAKSQFKEHAIDGRAAWVFVWARKASQEPAQLPVRG